MSSKKDATRYTVLNTNQVSAKVKPNTVGLLLTHLLGFDDAVRILNSRNVTSPTNFNIVYHLDLRQRAHLDLESFWNGGRP